MLDYYSAVSQATIDPVSDYCTMKFVDLITTKLNRPAISSYAIQRPRLIDALNAVDDKKLISIHAPAGFGKTTLLSQWISQSGKQHIWYSIDRGDADPRQFLMYMTAGLHIAGIIKGDKVFSLLDTSSGTGFSEPIRLIINAIAEYSKPLIFIIDDFHLISVDHIENIIIDLFHFSPDNFHLVVAGRSGINLDSSALRLQGNCVEFLSEDLRFNFDEMQSMLKEQLPLPVSEVPARELFQKTEGWAAGLQFALLSRPKQQGFSEFVASFSGSVREITQYLAANTMRQLSDEKRRFLITTCILDRFNAQVAAQLTGINTSQEIIEAMQADGMFIIALDNNGSWYRYHQLFRDYLLDIFNRKEAEQRSDVYTKAYQWFLEQNLREEAISYALLAGQIDQVVELIENEVKNLIERGAFPRVESWLKKIPEQYLYDHPSLILYRCWALSHIGLCYQSALWLEKIDVFLQSKPAEQSSLWHPVVLECKALKFVNAVTKDDMVSARQLMDDAVVEELIGPFAAGAVHNAKAITFLFDNAFETARNEIQIARQYHEQSHSIIGLIYTYCLECFIEFEQCRLYVCQQGIETAQSLLKARDVDDTSFTAALVTVLKALIMYTWNKPDNAAQLLQRCLPYIEECSYIEIKNIAFIVLARIYHQQHNSELALELLDRCLEVSSECVQERAVMQVGCEKLSILLDQSHTEEALELVKSHGIKVTEQIAVPECWDNKVGLQVYMWCLYNIETDADISLCTVVESMVRLAESAGRYRRMLDFMILSIRLLHRLGDSIKAQQVLIKTFDITYHEDYLSLYIERGNIVKPLLTQALETGKLCTDKEKFVRRLLVTFEADSHSQPSTAKPFLTQPYSVHDHTNSGVLQDLSERECAVLTLIAEGLPNKSIAKNLGITVNTVRWHVANILSKLNAQNRTQAVSKSRELGIIPR